MTEKIGLAAQIKGFPKVFWVANLLELGERLAYFGMRAVVALYIVDAVSRGGLEFTHHQRGQIFFWWALCQCLLPMFTGAFSDRYGYRISLAVAFTINTGAYVLMGLATSYPGFLAACLLLATGTAIFKPPVQGTLALTTNASNSSVGWGVFYMLVNVGGFLGPWIAGYMRLMAWRYVFFASAAIIACNFLPTLLLFDDLSKTAMPKSSKKPLQVLKEALTTLSDLRFAIFLAIFSGFWLMFMQLFDTLPIFIDEWVNSNGVVAWLGQTFGSQALLDRAAAGGQVPPEWMINLDSGAIVLFMILVAWITGRMRPIVAMIVGMLISCGGLILAGGTTSGWLCLLGIFVFAVGEMACSPKFSEYIGLTAPQDKKALYMGYSNIPFAVGWAVGGLLSGWLYGAYADKYAFARRYLVERLGQNPELAEKLDKTQIMPHLAQVLGTTEEAARELLWREYTPQVIWYVFAAIGFAATLAMVGYHFWLERDRKTAS